MKSSLKFTAIALLLGGVLHVQNLNAATVVSLDMLDELGKTSGRFSSAEGPKAFAAYVGGLVTQSIEPKILRSALAVAIFKPSVTPEFLEAARIAANPNVKALLTYCEGVKTGRISGDAVIRGLREELDTLAPKLEKRTNEIASLQDEVNELCDETEWLQSEVCDLSRDLGKAREMLQSTEVRAFMPLTGPSVITPAEELAAYTVVTSKPSTLPLAEQVYLLKVREHLGNPEKLEVSLSTQLDTLMRSVRNIASDVFTPESFSRAAFLVDVIPQVRGIVPIIGGYMKSILDQIAAINADVHSRGGYFVSGTPTPIQTLQLSELDARKNLAYSVFDAIFGAMTKPVTVPASVDFRADQSPANVLTSKVQTLHATLPLTVSSSAIVVKSDGSIAFSRGVDFSTGIELSSEFMVSIRTATTELLGKVLGAQTLVRGTIATSSVTGFTELAQAKASLLPPPALLATAISHLDTNAPTTTGDGEFLADDSSHGDSIKSEEDDGGVVVEEATA